jgi:nucleotide-binding universal stress UspA family protein
MPYKTILVHAGPGPGAPDRIRLAARLALAAGAHLVGSAPSGISRFMPPQVLAAGGRALAQHCAALREQAARALDQFAHIAAEEGVASAETRLVEDEADAGLALQARYCDLVVAGQAAPGVVTPLLPEDLPDYLVLTCGRPVLVVPSAGCPPDLGGEALVAWDGSVEAVRALDGALPLLRAARCTTVLAYANQAPWPETVEHPYAQLIVYLKRHGISARLALRTGQAGRADAFLSEANERGASLLVMGGYGHARLLELLTGGVTAGILRTLTLPVLLAH